MDSKKHEKLSRREREIMNAIHAAGGRASADEIRVSLPDPPSYSAVRAMLAKLEAKGHVRHIEEGLKYIYIPTKSLTTARRQALNQITDIFFGGSAGQTVAALLKQEKWTGEELDRLQTEIEAARKKQE